MPNQKRRDELRNIAIIAHVDHGKTTLVDAMLRQSGMFRQSQLGNELILDNNALERERGITILAKNVAMTYEDAKGVTRKINIIDTPGHADFGGEVERVLKMADGVLLLVDAFEGPMPQTRFVLKKAFQYHLKPIVVINKIDRNDARPNEVLNEVFDLFVELEADEDALDFPVIYASGRAGYARLDPADANTDMRPLLETIVTKIRGPVADLEKPLQMQITNIDYNEYVGRIGIGRVFNGVINKDQQIALLKRNGKVEKHKIVDLYLFEGLGRTKTPHAEAGDICAVVGIEDVDIGDTIAHPEHPEALPLIDVDEPTLSMIFSVNDSPFAGQDGKFVTSRNLRERLYRELQSNVALRVEDTQSADSLRVSGRGLLHLGVLLENMRREGFELQVSKPKVIFKELNGHKCEPIELLVIDVPKAFEGAVMQSIGNRRGELAKMDTKGNFTHMEFTIPARGLIGLRTRLLNATQGEAIMHHTFHDYELLRGALPGRQNGVLISMEAGTANAYALDKLADRGMMFIKPGDEVYEGMVVGEYNKDTDITVNVCREKKLSNMRTTGSDENIILKPPRDMSLEIALEYIEDDELVEITPKTIRLRKRYLRETDRKRHERSAAALAAAE
ncbi:MAG TPA: translational GTPase TypA [Phycisphaerae bacterium]|nr:translational GTPase TypA [Phycisphaerae bacterium]